MNEGLEGKDFADEIFGESSPPHTVPSDPNTVPTADTPQPITNTLHPNTNIPQPSTDTPGPSDVPPLNIDLDEEWVVLALEDDIVSVDGSDDEQRLGNLKFNEMTDMTNIRLLVGMKFPNSKVLKRL